MLYRLLFVLLYLRNLPEFDGNHVRTSAATRMDVDLIRYRRRSRVGRGRP